MIKNTALKIILINLFLVLVSVKIHAQQFSKSVKDYISVDTPVIALVDVKIIDGTGSPAKLHQTIIINKGIIEKIGNVTDIRIPENALSLNCSGKTIIPGLVMMHEHFFLHNSYTRAYF